VEEKMLEALIEERVPPRFYEQESVLISAGRQAATGRIILSKRGR
jgi:hypothetical protein